MAPTFAAVLKALETRGARLAGDGPIYAFGGADGELRDEAWAMCPACGWYGLRVDRLKDGRARVSCGNGGCHPEAILEALARALLDKAATEA